MTSKYEVEITITSAKDLKNVNWRHGKIKPYVVVWTDPTNKVTTRVDDEGDTCPHWDHALVVPLTGPIEDTNVYLDVVHAGANEGTKPLVGSARLSLREIVDEAGIGEHAKRKLELRRPSGRPQGKLELTVVVRRARDVYYRAPEPYYAPPPSAQTGYGSLYSVPQPATHTGYGNPYSVPQPVAQAGYGNPYHVPPVEAQSGYGNPYSAPQNASGAWSAYGQTEPNIEQEKKNKFGVGTGLAVGAVAGVLGGLAIAEGIDYVEDKIADDVTERVEDDLDDGCYDGDDF